jgi:hypothetical protein
MEKQTLTFTLERETKNTIRYQEEACGKPPAIGTLYVQKWLLGNEPPQKLTITIGEADSPHTAHRVGKTGRSIFLVRGNEPSLPGNGILRRGQRVDMKKRISGQYKVNLDTGQVYIVGSKASDRPVTEKQASLLQWGEDKVKLGRWPKDGEP